MSRRWGRGECVLNMLENPHNIWSYITRFLREKGCVKIISRMKSANTTHAVRRASSLILHLLSQVHAQDLFSSFLTATVKTSASNCRPWSNQTTSTCALHLVANFEKLKKPNDLGKQTGPVQEGKSYSKSFSQTCEDCRSRCEVEERRERLRDLIDAIDAIAGLLISTGNDIAEHVPLSHFQLGYLHIWREDCQVHVPIWSSADEKKEKKVEWNRESCLNS